MAFAIRDDKKDIPNVPSCREERNSAFFSKNA